MISEQIQQAVQETTSTNKRRKEYKTYIKKHQNEVYLSSKNIANAVNDFLSEISMPLSHKHDIALQHMIVKCIVRHYMNRKWLTSLRPTIQVLKKYKISEPENIIRGALSHAHVLHYLQDQETLIEIPLDKNLWTMQVADAYAKTDICFVSIKDNTIDAYLIDTKSNHYLEMWVILSPHQKKSLWMIIHNHLEKHNLSPRKKISYKRIELSPTPPGNHARVHPKLPTESNYINYHKIQHYLAEIFGQYLDD